MTTTVDLTDVLNRLAKARLACPEMRLGQLLATVALLAEDKTGQSLWDVEDDEFASALVRFAEDLERRKADQFADPWQSSTPPRTLE